MRNYPGSSHSIAPEIYYKNNPGGHDNPGGPKYYFISEFSIQETHWLCPCLGCDPTYLEIIPAGSESRAVSIFVD
jgi:hypothetical protein